MDWKSQLEDERFKERVLQLIFYITEPKVELLTLPFCMRNCSKND